jgi:predicted unusual protein kinase regulating ubiquinone biosynthesis (AarF/ABC1/UbiB family)
VSDDPIERLRKRIAVAAKLPTSALGRVRRTAGAALKAGVGRLTGKGDVEIFEQLAVQLGELKGTAMKVGQILSYLDTELPEEAKRLLAVLQVSSQPTPFDEIAKAAPPELLATMERQPVATASIGQVHRATLPDGTRVAVKVKHPGIEQAIAADFRSAAAGSALPGLVMPGVAEVIGEARDTLLAECDYAAERKWQERFGALYAGHPSIAVPEVHGAWCSDRVLVTTWCDGLTFENFCASASQQARDRAGCALYEFYVGSVYRFGLFNGDPHPGNLLFRDDGSLIVLDYGCVKEFRPQLVRALAALSRAVRADDPRAIRHALVELGAAEPDEKAYAVTRQLLRGFFGPVLIPGPHRVESGLSLDLREILKDKLAVARMRLPPKLLFLFRIRFGLHSELTRLKSVADWGALEERFVTSVAALGALR